MTTPKKKPAKMTPKTLAKPKAKPDIDADLRVKSWPNWQSASSSMSTTSLNGQRQPSVNELISAFTDTVYACVSLIANKTAEAKIRLYVRTDPGQHRTRLPTKRPTYKALRQIVHTKKLHRGTIVEEVTDHPLLDLICDRGTYHNAHESVIYTQSYVEIVGNAFWALDINDFTEKPDSYKILAPQAVTPIRDERTKNIIAWKFGIGSDAIIYPKERIIHFKGTNLADPYGLGMSPLTAAWSRVLIQTKELAFLSSNLENNGRADAILSPQEAIGPFEAERLAKDFIARFRGKGAGGVFVADGPMTVTPIPWPMKDFAELNLFEVVKKSLSNCYHIPPDIWETGTSSNRSTKEAALYSLAVDCIKPRVTYLCEKLNELCRWYDDTGRLFFDCDDVVPEDKEFVLKEMQFLATSQAVTRNELRDVYGYDHEPWGNEPLVPPGAMLQTTVEQQADPRATAAEVAEQPAQNLALNGAQMASLQSIAQAVASGQLPAATGIQLIMVSIPTLTQAQATAIIDPAAAFTPANPDAAPEPQDAPVRPEPEQMPEPVPPTKSKAIDLPDLRQSYDYDCGASATQTVCQFYGVGPATEDEYVEALGTTPEGGTPPEAIVTFLQGLGLQVEARNDLTIPDLAGAGVPIICCIQDYEDEPADIAEERAGHYVVVSEATDDTVTFQDPSGGRVEMPTLDFLARWEDTDGEGQFIHYGIIVRPATEPKKTIRKMQAKKNPQSLIDALKRFFKRQESKIIGEVKQMDADIVTKAMPSDWLDLADWNNVFAQEMLPTVALYYDDAAKQTVKRIGGSPDLWAVVQPNLKEAVEKQVFAFADSTNRTTSMELGTAIETLKKEMAEGLEAGDYKNLLADRVKSVFERASVERSYLIGATEASRSQHEAMEITAIKSGVCKNKRWIASANACPLCLALNGKVVPLGKPFVVDGTGPYAEVQYGPRHPGCLCDTVEVIDD